MKKPAGMLPLLVRVTVPVTPLEPTVAEPKSTGFCEAPTIGRPPAPRSSAAKETPPVLARSCAI